MELSTRDLGSASDADRGFRFKDHFASTQPRSGSDQCVLCCVTVREQCNARSLRAMWSSHATTLNPYRGSVSSESVFSARVESPNMFQSLSSKVHWFSKMYTKNTDYIPVVGIIFMSHQLHFFYCFMLTFRYVGIFFWNDSYSNHIPLLLTNLLTTNLNWNCSVCHKIPGQFKCHELFIDSTVSREQIEILVKGYKTSFFEGKKEWDLTRNIYFLVQSIIFIHSKRQLSSIT